MGWKYNLDQLQVLSQILEADCSDAAFSGIVRQIHPDYLGALWGEMQKPGGEQDVKAKCPSSFSRE